MKNQSTSSNIAMCGENYIIQRSKKKHNIDYDLFKVYFLRIIFLAYSIDLVPSINNLYLLPTFNTKWCKRFLRALSAGIHNTQLRAYMRRHWDKSIVTVINKFPCVAMWLVGPLHLGDRRMDGHLGDRRMDGRTYGWQTDGRDLSDRRTDGRSHGWQTDGRTPEWQTDGRLPEWQMDGQTDTWVTDGRTTLWWQTGRTETWVTDGWTDWHLVDRRIPRWDQKPTDGRADSWITNRQLSNRRLRIWVTDEPIDARAHKQQVNWQTDT